MSDTEKLKSYVSGNTKVRFVKYFDGDLWYQVIGADDVPMGFEFPVPVKEAGTATFYATDRAMLFMRYMRKHLTMLMRAAKPQCPMSGCGPEDECPGHMDGHNA